MLTYCFFPQPPAGGGPIAGAKYVIIISAQISLIYHMGSRSPILPSPKLLTFVYRPYAVDRRRSDMDGNFRAVRCDLFVRDNGFFSTLYKNINWYSGHFCHSLPFVIWAWSKQANNAGGAVTKVI